MSSHLLRDIIVIYRLGGKTYALSKKYTIKHFDCGITQDNPLKGKCFSKEDKEKSSPSILKFTVDNIIKPGIQGFAEGIAKSSAGHLGSACFNHAAKMAELFKNAKFNTLS